MLSFVPAHTHMTVVRPDAMGGPLFVAGLRSDLMTFMAKEKL
jgi:hypothetical protein